MCRKLSKFMVSPGYKTAAFLTRFRLIKDNCNFIALYSVFFVLASFLITMCDESSFFRVLLCYYNMSLILVSNYYFSVKFRFCFQIGNIFCP